MYAPIWFLIGKTRENVPTNFTHTNFFACLMIPQNTVTTLRITFFSNMPTNYYTETKILTCFRIQHYFHHSTYYLLDY